MSGRAGVGSVVLADGRRARGVRNRDAVADALLDLLREGEVRPSAAMIADRAGVSLRSVFRHFEDLEALQEAAVARHFERSAPLFEVASDPGASLDDRVDALVRARARLWEDVGPIRRVAEQVQDRSESVRDGLARARRLFRQQLHELFEPELADLTAAERRLVLDALEVATSWAAWQQARDEQRCSVGRAQAILARTVAALVRT